MSNLFNKDYYENGKEKGISCYTNYRWLPELTIPMCSEIIQHLDIKDSETILDFGCSKGFLVKAMRLLHKEAYGVDISEYAILNAPSDISRYLYLLKDNDIPLNNFKRYDWVIAKDVLEHVDYKDILDVLISIRKSCKKAFIIVPLGEDGSYIIPDYELDITHKIRENPQWWTLKFIEAGFKIKEFKYTVKHIKENWYKWPNGNGFFTLEINE